MKVELPALLPDFLPVKALSQAVRVSKELLRSQAASKKGDKTLIDSSITSAWVTSLRPDLCGQASLCETKSDVTEILVILCHLSEERETQRLRELFHISIPHCFFLLMQGREKLYLSLSRGKGGSGSDVWVDMDSFHGAFVQDIKSAFSSAKHLGEVFDRWFCSLHALKLALRGSAMYSRLSYAPLDSPTEASELESSLAQLESDWQKAKTELKKIHSPQGRIDAANRRMKSAQAISHLLTSHNLITQ